MIAHKSQPLGLLEPAGAARLRLFRNYGLIAKDLVQQGRLVVIMLIATVLVQFAPWISLDLSDHTRQALYQVAPDVFHAMFIATALLFGIVLSSDEVEHKTTTLLLAQPISPLGVMLRKLVVGLLLLGAWVVLAGLTLGFISGYGLEMFSVLGRQNFRLLTLMDSFQGAPMVPLVGLSLLITGLTFGWVFRTMVSSALLAAVAFFAYLTLLDKVLAPVGWPPMQRQAMHVAGYLIWLGLMVYLFPRLYRRSTYAEGLKDFSIPALERAGQYLRFRRRGKVLPFDPPHARLLRMPAVYLAMFYLVSLPLLAGDGPGMLFVLLLPAPAAFVGAAVFTPEERYSSRHFIYALPLVRTRTFWLRARSLGIWGTFIGAAFFVGFAIAVWKSSTPGHRNDIESLPVYVPLVICAASVILFVLGGLYRLLFKSRLAAAFFAYVTLISCLVISVISFSNFLRMEGISGGDSQVRIPTSAWFYLLWMCCVGIGLPLLALWLAYCRSHLLETSEGLRGRLALLLLLLFVGWGGALLSAAPTHLLSILTGR